MTGVLEGSGAPGLAVAVIVDDRMVRSQGFGFADLEARAPASPTTLFRAGSISKSFTSVGLVLLVGPKQKHLSRGQVPFEA
jgi:CubicO group peptidase (beta-lactamase class C family)